jgi:epoxyqueuosine reductase
MGRGAHVRRGIPTAASFGRRFARLRRDATGFRILLTPSALRDRIERIALDAGATAVAFADADDDALTRERLRASFARGDLATWPYDDAYAHRASSPGDALANARSVVCVAVAYATPKGGSRGGPLRGRVSNYAWSRDYHRTLRELLARVAHAIDELAGEPATRIACDTAPLSERALAARAGLGWVGKHTNLIVPGSGSFVFLGEVVTTLALPTSAPSKKTCGTCARCVTACPTGALRGDYTIDARLCIADLTQRTDAIPRDLRPLIGDWVWGCDLCQDVCPPTKRAGANGAPTFAPVDDAVAEPPLVELLRLRSGTFKRRFAPTAMGWRGAAVLRRNAAVALGNALDRAAVPALAQALEADPHEQVRGHAAWALGRIGSPGARDALARASDGESSPFVRDEIASALATLSWKP